MKFVIITDIHLGPEGYWRGILRKINANAKQYLTNFVVKMNNDTKPEFVIVLGDLIEDDNPKKDTENLKYIVSKLSGLNCPVHYVAGNHDLRNVSETELMNIFQQKCLYYSFDSNNIHYIVLFSRVVGKEETRIDGTQLEWLRQELHKTNHKCIVFVHHGLADQSLQGNAWFNEKPEYALIENRNTVRSVLEEQKNVLAVFNSHLHWDKKHVHNSIPYYTIQSFIENEDDKGIASEAYAIVDVSNNKVFVKVEGNYSKEL